MRDLRRVKAIATATDAEIPMVLPKGAKIHYIIMECSSPPTSNGLEIRFAMRTIKGTLSNCGNAGSPGTILHDRIYVITSGISSSYKVYRMFGKMLEDGQLYAHIYHSIGSTQSFAITVLYEV